VFNDNISEVQTVLSTQSDEYSTTANAITELRSAINLEDGVSGTASAVEVLNTYVGITVINECEIKMLAQVTIFNLFF